MPLEADPRVCEAGVDSEERSRSCAENVPAQIWTAHADGKLDYVTDPTARYFGLPVARLLADGWQSVVHPEDLALAVEQWTRALETGQPYEVEFRLRIHTGLYAWHRARAVPRRSASGTIVGWLGTNTNIEEQRDHQRRTQTLLDQVAAQAEQLRHETAFVATASHELRTPLNAILGWASILRGGTLDASGVVRAIEIIERNAKAQAQLIEDILDGARIITGTLPLEMGALDLVDVLRSALDAVRPAAAAKSISIGATVDRAAGRMRGDPDRLTKVVFHLVGNAVKFTPKGGTVDVSLAHGDTSIELAVKDTGQGIAQDFLPRVFERFRRADARASRRQGGLGLGLAFVRHVVEAHGGAVRVESEGKGRGARFVVTFPKGQGVGEVVGAAAESL